MPLEAYGFSEARAAAVTFVGRLLLTDLQTYRLTDLVTDVVTDSRGYESLFVRQFG